MLIAVARFFGIGAVPKAHRGQLVEEGVTLLDEVIPVTVAYLHADEQGSHRRHQQSRMLGSIVLTSKRIVGYGFSKPVMNIPLTDPRLAKVQWYAHPRGQLVLTLTAGLFQPEQAGDIQVVFATSRAQQFIDQLPLKRDAEVTASSSP